MIVNIRGTGGSGKSTLARRVMEQYGMRTANYVDGRRQPISYICSGRPGSRPLFVPGHYEIACGGCDTLKTPRQAFDLVREADVVGMDVLFEGIMVADDVTQTVALNKFVNGNMVVILLTTPIEVCLNAIRERRAERAALAGKESSPLNTKNTISRAKSHANRVRDLEQAGVRAERLDRDSAFNRTMELLSGHGRAEQLRTGTSDDTSAQDPGAAAALD